MKPTSGRKSTKEEIRLQNSNIKKCPNCNSDDVRDIYIRMHDSAIPVYKCNSCGCNFRYIESDKSTPSL